MPEDPQESNAPEPEVPQAPKADAAASVKSSSPKSVTEPSQSQETLDQVKKQAQQYWAKAQPVLKEKSIQALLVTNRFTDHFLDNIWPKLSKQAIAAVPASAKTKLEAQKAKVQPTLDKVQPFWQKAVVPFWQNTVVPNWNKGLGLLRQRLPEPLKQNLTNRFMTLLILVLAFWVYSFFSSLGSGKPTVAKQPVVPTPTPTPISQRPMRQLPTQPSPQTAPIIKPSPSPVGVASPSPKPSPVAITSPKPSPVVVASPKPSPVVVASPKPSPVVVASPKPSPVAAPIVAAKPVAIPPAIDLATIQTQLTSAIAAVGESLIHSVQTVDHNNRLQVDLGDDWYTLSEPNQTKVAQTLLERSQSLKFGKFELRDNAGELVARSPLIGSDVIILKRQAQS